MSMSTARSSSPSAVDETSVEGGTRTATTASRCGTPDPEVGVAFVTRCAWPTANLTYAFDIGTIDVANALEFDAVRTAFATWTAVAPVTFTEVGGGTQNPDVMIGWRPAEDPDRSMVGSVHAHAAFPPSCSGSTLPKPIHFDATETTWAIGAVRGAMDVESVALHEIGHILGLAHSTVAGAVMGPFSSTNSTERVLADDDIAGVHQLYPPHRLAAGTYTIRQLSSGRFLDAHETSVEDHRAVTVPGAADDRQRWDLSPIGTVCSLRHKSSGRFLDAHEIVDFDFRLVIRPMQGNSTQRWVLLSSTGGSTTIQQLSNARFVDAHDTAAKDFAAITRPAEQDDSQRWHLEPAGPNQVTIRHRQTGRFLDAHETPDRDFSVVTRAAQGNDSQRWIVAEHAVVYLVRQRSSRRFLDAHETPDRDFSVVTRPSQADDSQLWVLEPVAPGTFSVRQLQTGRFLDAFGSAANQFRVVTRTAQNDSSQQWVFDPFGSP
jgi:hypothetical protein